MFDTILFRCPKCGKGIDQQSKAGDCDLIDYDCRKVPIEIAISINGTGIYCDECRQKYLIASDMVITHVGMSLIAINN